MSIIQNTGPDVQAKHPADNIIANVQAGAASVSTQTKDASATGVKNEQLLLAKDLKPLISLKELMESDRHQFKQSGHYSMCCCPFHADRTPSFGIRDDDDGTGKCFGCGWYGNIFDYEMQFHKSDFTLGMAEAEMTIITNPPRKGRKAKADVRTTRPNRVQLTERQKDDREKWGLAGWRPIDGLPKRYVAKRYEYNGERWNPDTIQAIATWGPLGWAGDALAFMYSTGTKFRKWPGREFYWDCECLSLWRGYMIEGMEHIYITEGETDAITMLDMGIEDTLGVAVVAAPSATSFYSEWAPQFEGMKVTLCFDNDEEGQRGSERAGRLIQPYASEVLVLDLGGAI